MCYSESSPGPIPIEAPSGRIGLVVGRLVELSCSSALLSRQIAGASACSLHDSASLHYYDHDGGCLGPLSTT